MESLFHFGNQGPEDAKNVQGVIAAVDKLKNPYDATLVFNGIRHMANTAADQDTAAATNEFGGFLADRMARNLHLTVQQFTNLADQNLSVHRQGSPHLFSDTPEPPTLLFPQQ
jgi:hypothetical protein